MFSIFNAFHISNVSHTRRLIYFSQKQFPIVPMILGLLKTVCIQSISQHIFLPNGRYFVYYPSNLFRNARRFGGQFTLSTQLMKENYLATLPTNAAPQFLWKLTPFIHLVSYTARHLFQRVAEHKNSAIGKHFHEAHDRRDR